MAHKLKRGMNVAVIAGKDKGKTGKILHIDRDTNRIIVEGVNMVKVAERPSQLNQTGGVIEREGTLHSSNVLAVDPSKDRPVRIGFERDNETKRRVTRGANASGESVEPKERS